MTRPGPGGGPTRAPGEGSIEVRASLGPLADEWDALAAVPGEPTAFLRSWWLEGIAGPATRFVLVRRGERLLGGVALERDRRRGVPRYRLLGATPYAAHDLDLVAGPDDVATVVAGLGSWVAGRRAAIVDLTGLRAGAALEAIVPTGAERTVVDAAPYLEVPATFEEYLAARGRKVRQEIRRILRRLEEDGVTHRVVDRGDHERALRTLLELHERRWGTQSRLLPGRDGFERAARLGSRRGDVVFHEVVAGERVVASMVAFELADRAYWYQTGRDPEARWSNVGSFLKAHAVARSCEVGHRMIDLCAGTAAHKTGWADGDRPLRRVRWSRGPLAGAVLTAMRLRARRAAGTGARRGPDQ